MFNLEEIKAIPILEICQIYGIETEKKGKHIKFKLRNEKTASAVIYKETNSWYDFGFARGGDNINLIMELDGVDRTRAINIIGERFGVENKAFNRSKKILPTKAEFKEIGINPDRAIANFKIDLENQSLEKLEEWEEKYSISMYNLAKENEFIYHKIIDGKVFTILNKERKDFLELKVKYEIEEEELNKKLYLDTLNKMKDNIDKTINIYHKARLDKRKIYHLKVNI